jgi:hypothetical protein
MKYLIDVLGIFKNYPFAIISQNPWKDEVLQFFLYRYRPESPFGSELRRK